MSRYPFSYTWRDENGIELIPDIECEVEIEVGQEYDREPFLDVIGVWLNGVDVLCSKSPAFRNLGCAIADAAECDERIVEAALEDAGIVWRGHGANDPGGYFEVAS